MPHLFICLSIFLPLVISNPTGCTYDATTVLYTCDGRGWTLPMDFSQFTVQPQRIFLKDVAGELPASAPNGPTFTGFSAINTALFDARFSPSFHIRCFATNSLLIFKDTFQDFGWVDEIVIQDCDILSLPAEVFSYFGEVNSFIIKGGSITNMVADSFRGLDVKKMTTAPSPKGEFIIENSEIDTGQLSFGALFNIPNASVIALDNAHLTSLRTDTFYSVPKLANLSISYNSLTSIPESLLAKSNSLAHLEIWGVPWVCSCSSLWFIPFAIDNNITLSGDFICASPAAFANKRAATFYSDNCVTYNPCDGKIGIRSGNKCISVLEILTYIFFVLMTIVACIAFGFVINLYLHLKEIQDRRQGFMLRRAPVTDVDKVAKLQTFDTRKTKPIKTRDPSFE